MTRLRPLLLLLTVGMLTGFGQCASTHLAILSPPDGALTGASSVPLEVRVPHWAVLAEMKFFVSGVQVSPTGLTRVGDMVTGTLVGAFGGHQKLVVEVPDDEAPRLAMAAFEGVALNSPAHCEVLNDAACMLPFPSSRYLKEDESTPTGWRVDLPVQAMPNFVVGSLTGFLNGSRAPLNPAPYNKNDGFSPTAQILMHFPGGVDLVASNVARIDPVTRNFDLRSLEADSPTILMDAVTGERIPHFVENDDRGVGPRTATILRPAKSLLPGRRYIVAVRDVVHAGGAPVGPETAFAALRDERPTTIPEIEARRAAMQSIFWRLGDNGIDSNTLVLAFDFHTQSDEALTGEMLAMRDAAFAFVDAQPGSALISNVATFELTPAAQCTPGAPWRAMLGQFKVPNFLTTNPGGGVQPPADPVGQKDLLGFLAHDANGDVLQTGTYDARFGFSLPCEAVLGGPVAPVVFGHGLFGNGAIQAGTLGGSLLPYVAQLQAAGLVSANRNFNYGVAGTHWSGLSSLDIAPLPGNLNLNNPSAADINALITFTQSFVGQLFVNFDNFQAMPDRLRQGQLATLVLARLMGQGKFNELPQFQTPVDAPVGAGHPTIAAGDVNYFGASLGGIMGLMFTSLYPELERSVVDVPAINFSFMLQRAKPFRSFQTVLELIDPDPIRQLIGLGLLHETWVKGESAGYVHHISGETLPHFPGSGNKHVLMTVARYDQQVSTLGAQIAAATMGLNNLPGSVEKNLPLVPDHLGQPPLSGHVMYDTGAYVVGEATEAYIPPTVNRPAPFDDNDCDPHAARFTIPASVEQMMAFLEPLGRIENFCNGDCDAAEAVELPGGLAAPCVPAPPPSPPSGPGVPPTP